MNNGKMIEDIKNGIVIDHIPRGKVWTIATKILNLDKLEEGKVSLGNGYESKKIPEGKGLLKVEGVTLSRQQLNYLALISEKINVSFIKRGEVKEKLNVRIPSHLEGLVLCANAGCISRDVSQKVVSKVDYDSEKEQFKCHYCKTCFNESEVELNLNNYPL